MIRNTGSKFAYPPDRKTIDKKKTELSKYDTDLYGQLPGLEKIVEKAALYCNVYSDNVVDLALRLEEDVAIMHQGQLAAICFCFPSGFLPCRLLGMELSEIHKPVADNQTLVKASPGIARVMCEQDSFLRHVWTVTANPDLSNHPCNVSNTVPESIDELYFRWETQTTAKVDQETSLFFVKVQVVPLRDIWNTRIIESINSMSDNVLNYKNLQHIKSLLNLHF